MARNPDTLSTRDLVSPGQPAGGDTTMGDGEVRDPAAADPVVADPAAADPAGGFDQTGAGEPGTPPAAEVTAADEPSGPPVGEPDGVEAATGGSTGGQPVAASRGDTRLDRDTTGGGGEHPAANSTPAVSVRDQATPAGSRSTDEPAGGSDAGGSLLSADLDSSFQQRWQEVQTRFVDEPRGAVQDADSLVANLMQQLADGFAKERERLEAQWGRGEDISTEDLRVALQRYRTFFQRLLST